MINGELLNASSSWSPAFIKPDSFKLIQVCRDLVGAKTIIISGTPRPGLPAPCIFQLPN